MISVRFSEMRYKVDMDTSLNRDPLQLLGNVALSLKELIARVPARQHHEVINEDMPAVFDSSGISHCVKGIPGIDRPAVAVYSKKPLTPVEELLHLSGLPDGETAAVSHTNHLHHGVLRRHLEGEQAHGALLHHH